MTRGEKLSHLWVSIGKRVWIARLVAKALEDHFKRGDKTLLKTYVANRGYIQHQARLKYFAEELESDQSVLIRTLDL